MHLVNWNRSNPGQWRADDNMDIHLLATKMICWKRWKTGQINELSGIDRHSSTSRVLPSQWCCVWSTNIWNSHKLTLSTFLSVSHPPPGTRCWMADERSPLLQNGQEHGGQTDYLAAANELERAADTAEQQSVVGQGVLVALVILAVIVDIYDF